jgi:DNA-binding GntR family transcriptional regulator
MEPAARGGVAHARQFDDGIDNLAPTSLVDLALGRIRAEILSGALEPGDHLVEEQLTRRFGISRAPLREALRLLAEQGLVDHLPRRGVRVATLSDRDFDELFAVRDSLERFAVELLLARPALERDLALLSEQVDRMTVAANADDRLAASQAHRGFHLAFIALADSRQLALTYEPVLSKLQLYMAANLRREAEERSPAEGARRHKRLFDAISSGERERITEELAHHGARTFFH